MLVAMPSSQPSSAAARTIQTSDAWLEPATQLSFTWRVFATASAITITSSPMTMTAQA